MALPILTPDEKRKALEKAQAMRKARAELREKLKKGDLRLEDILEKDDPVVARMKVSYLLKSCLLYTSYQRPVDAPEHFPGNPWFVTTGWYVMSGLILKTISTEQAFHWLDWFRQKSLESGVLSEQLNGLTGTCLSVAPLIWSHSTYVDLANLIKHGLQ